jgi:hypothetical protein
MFCIDRLVEVHLAALDQVAAERAERMAVLVGVADAQALAVGQRICPEPWICRKKSSTGSFVQAMIGAGSVALRDSISARDQYGTRRRPSSRPRRRMLRTSGLTEPSSTTIRSSGTP